MKLSFNFKSFKKHFIAYSNKYNINFWLQFYLLKLLIFKYKI
uniref:Uncharacterized protein n=1 Tax=Nephromyces sp. ex Molgula occidentalis TaxID=2544991 RepID=A0A5C1H864_9APIC|nr:hypothetical protein [Nephromyces sp. ex Molgula occidentalis]